MVSGTGRHRSIASWLCLLLLALPVSAGCAHAAATVPTSSPATAVPVAVTAPPKVEAALAADVTAVAADITAVAITGGEGAYQFAVTVSSPDTGCAQFADWWEVLSADGELLYRRVLLHSHVDEQPFTRSGGPVDVPADAVVIIRAHLAPGGYGGTAFRGSVAGGFAAVELDAGFAAGVETQPPLPDGCAF